MAATTTANITRNLNPANVANETSTGARNTVISYLVQGDTSITCRLEKETVLTNHVAPTWGN